MRGGQIWIVVVVVVVVAVRRGMMMWSRMVGRVLPFREAYRSVSSPIIRRSSNDISIKEDLRSQLLMMGKGGGCECGAHSIKKVAFFLIFLIFFLPNRSLPERAYI